MRGAPLYVACWAMAMAAAVVNAVNSDASYERGQPRRLLEPVDVAADRETVAYLLPRLAAKYRPSGEWNDVTDPRFYVLTEMDDDDVFDEQQIPNIKTRHRRHNIESASSEQRHLYSRDNRGSLSITAPLDSLRNLYNQKQLEKNREIFNNLRTYQ